MPTSLMKALQWSLGQQLFSIPSIHNFPFSLLIEYLPLTSHTNAVFSLNFNSADKGPFTASKAKNIYHRGVRFPGQAGSGVR